MVQPMVVFLHVIKEQTVIDLYEQGKLDMQPAQGISDMTYDHYNKFLNFN